MLVQYLALIAVFLFKLPCLKSNAFDLNSFRDEPQEIELDLSQVPLPPTPVKSSTSSKKKSNKRGETEHKEEERKGKHKKKKKKKSSKRHHSPEVHGEDQDNLVSSL